MDLCVICAVNLFIASIYSCVLCVGTFNIVVYWVMEGFKLENLIAYRRKRMVIFIFNYYYCCSVLKFVLCLWFCRYRS